MLCKCFVASLHYCKPPSVVGRARARYMWTARSVIFAIWLFFFVAAHEKSAILQPVEKIAVSSKFWYCEAVSPCSLEGIGIRRTGNGRNCGWFTYQTLSRCYSLSRRSSRRLLHSTLLVSFPCWYVVVIFYVAGPCRTLTIVTDFQFINSMSDESSA